MTDVMYYDIQTQLARAEELLRAVRSKLQGINWDTDPLAVIQLAKTCNAVGATVVQVSQRLLTEVNRHAGPD